MSSIMPYFKDIQIVGWDLDGTLYPLTDEIRFKVDEKIYEKIQGKTKWPIERCKKEFQSRYDRLHTATGALMELGFEKEIMQRCLEEADILDLLNYNTRLVKMFNDLKHLRHILVTGSSKELSKEKINRLGLDNVFEYLVTIEDVSQPKPHPESWQKLLNYTRLPSSAHVWVDDRIEHASVAKTLGMKTILVGKPSNEMDLCVPEIYDVGKYLVI